MRLFGLLAVAAIALAADSLKVFDINWSVPIGADWSVEQDDTPVLRMLVERPQTQPRRPSQFALAETPLWKQVTLEAEVKRLGGSLILVYAYQDPAHFNYAHLSVDTAKKQPVHNGIFHVYGGDRVRISSDTGPASLPSEDEWYKVRLDYDASKGEVTVLVNGERNPSLHAIDLSLGTGKVGIGSFFEKALFRNVRISGTPAD
jgi:hypothetical protein